MTRKQNSTTKRRRAGSNDEKMNGHPEDARRLAKQLLEEETAGAMRWKAASYLIAAIIGSLIWIVLHACWRALGG